MDSHLSTTSLRTRLPERNLDVLRAIAVIAVVADHTIRAATTQVDRVSLSELGLFGVYIFFVHTALVLMGSLERSGTDGHWVRHFYVRRAFRIYPLAWAALVVVLLTRAPAFISSPTQLIAYRSPTAHELVSNMGLMQNLLDSRDLLAPLWSLPIEVQMYVMLPVAFLLARRFPRRLGLIALLGCLVSFVEWHVRLTTWDVPLLWRLTVLSYVPCFTCGIIAYAVLLRRGTGSAPAWTLALSIPAACAALVLAHRYLGTQWAWLGCLAVLGIVVGVRDMPECKLTRAAKTIATYSYGVYLLHSFALAWAFVTLKTAPALVQWAVFGTLLTGLPWLAYHAVERPGITLGKWLTESPISSRATSPAVVP